jgi:hypothetical protein
MDLESDRVANWLEHPRFRFLEGDVSITTSGSSTT